MIKNVVLIMLLSSTLGYSQVAFPVNDAGAVEFVQIIQIDTISKKDLYNKSKLWVVNAFNSANDVIQYDNQEEGRIVCKGLIPITSTGMGMNGTIHRSQAGNVRLTLEIAVKENRARIRLYDIAHEAELSGGKIENKKPACGGMYMTAKTWASIQKQADEKIKAVMSEYEASVRSSKSDW